MTKLKLKIDGMHCTSCALNIDMDLEDLDGVLNSHTSYAKSETEIEYDEKKIDRKKLIEAIATTGYKASPIE